MRHYLLLLLLFCLGVSAHAQTAATDAAVAKAVAALEERGYTTEVNGGNIRAFVPDKEYYEIFINKEGYMPSFQIRTDLGSFSYPDNDPYDVYSFANISNKQLPFVKFTVSSVQAGALALVDGRYAEDDIVSYSVDGMVTTFFGSDEQLIMILNDCLNTFRAIKEKMPHNLTKEY